MPSSGTESRAYNQSVTRSAIAVLVCTLLALLVATLWIPTDSGASPGNVAPGADGGFWSITPLALNGSIEFFPVWRWRIEDGVGWVEDLELQPGWDESFTWNKPYWPLWLAEWLAIFAVGIGVLLWTRRRERRRLSVLRETPAAVPVDDAE